MTLVTPAVPATTVAQLNATGQNVDVAVTGGTVTGILVTPPVLPPVTTPAIPASTVAAANTNPFPVAVVVTGGTVTVISVGGVSSGLTSGTVVVPAGSTIAITYSVVPTSWVWSALADGRSGTAIPSPTSLMLPPGASITLIYSVAPTWAWTNPSASIYPPGYATYNTLAELPGYNPDTILPYAQHDGGGAPKLMTGVSN